MNNKPKLLDVVALLKNLPDHHLVTGQVGTVVEMLDMESYLVEFCNHKGETLAMVSLKTGELLLLHYDLIAA
jgi:hypothetical protein